MSIGRAEVGLGSEPNILAVERPTARWPGFLDPRIGVARRLLHRIGHGRLAVTAPGGVRLVGESAAGEDAALNLHNWRALLRVLTGGDIGFAQAVIDGDCSSPDLVALLRLFDRNISALGVAANPIGPSRWLQRLAYLAQANTRRGAARNIMAHYDLGNAFFEAWLDPSMSYSSAIYADSADTLETAQARKHDRIVELLRLKGGERALELGCGWGGLAARLIAAGVGSVDALTISPSQAEYARGRLAALPSARVLLQDYRDAGGTYDRIVSIEMCEAVGEAYLPLYFQTIARGLKAGGRAVIQTISIADKRFASYRANADFIQRFIFPGGFLPSDALIRDCVSRARLRLAHAETFGLSYALTLAEWRRRFHANWTRIAALGFDARFRRLWDYYLCYCEAGFREGTVDVGLYVLEPA
jgi:cyclopropane-fatty-acyl-phospholipid synthase